MNKVILTILITMHILCLAEEYHLIAAPPNFHETDPPPQAWLQSEARDEIPIRNKGHSEEHDEEKEEKEEETEEKEWSTGRLEPQTNEELYKKAL